jgi:hypothetical protein
MTMKLTESHYFLVEFLSDPSASSQAESLPVEVSVEQRLA